jgi:hypothetical protein
VTTRILGESPLFGGPIKPSKPCILGATATGGVEPYTYEWAVTSGNAKILAVFPDQTDEMMFNSGTGSSTFRVTARDQVGNTGVRSRTISTSTSGVECQL